MYRVFKRTWWKNNPEWPNGLEPSVGKKRTVQTVDTEQEARNLCKEINLKIKDSRLGLKAEFERV